MNNYHYLATLSPEVLVRHFNSSLTHGLSTTEVQKKQRSFGLNELRSSFSSIISLLGGQIQSPFLYLLSGCALLSYTLGDTANTVIILVIIMVNISLSFIQEFRANKAVKLLASYITSNARVVRNGKQEVVASRELVPGDIVLLSSGDMIPADIRLVNTNHMLVDESVLTGESFPVAKDHNDVDKNIAYHGTTISGGMGVGIVIATGTHTSFGHITMVTLTTPHEGSFRLHLLQLSRFLISLSIALFVVTLLLHLVVKKGFFSISQLISFCVALAISITPEMLPLITLIALTQGALQLAARRVIVKRLSAIEDLGNIQVLCSDKTGTLTENRLTVIDYLNLVQNKTWFDPIFSTAVANPLTATSFESAAFQSLSQKQQQDVHKIVIRTELPFDPAKRQSGLIVEQNNKLYVIIKGALEEIIKSCSHRTDLEKKHLTEWEYMHSSKGQRVLALAYKPVGQETEDIPNTGFALIGLVAFADPIKPTVHDALQHAKRLGIIIKILTGDNQDVATTVALTIGLITSKEQVMTGDELQQLPAHQVKETIKKIVVFARVTPEQKCFIIEHLKQDSSVGFLGEGINDAPALKVANVGVVVSKASEIAQSAADIVMLKKSLATIIDAISLGRSTFINTMKYLRITLSSNLGNFLSIAIASLFLPYLPMLPLQILLANLLSDIPFTAISTDHVDHRELKKPTEYTIRELFASILTFGSISSLIDFVFFFKMYVFKPAIVQTGWFLLSFFTELAAIFILRSKAPLFSDVRPSLLLVLFSLLVGIIGFLATYVPLGKKLFHFEALDSHVYSIIALLIGCYVILMIITKSVYYRINRATNKA